MHLIKICMGSTCRLNFGPDTLAAAEETLGIKAGESTPDGRFRLEKTACLSHCELGPNVAFMQQAGPLSIVMTDGHVERNMLPHRLKQKLEELKNNP